MTSLEEDHLAAVLTALADEFVVAYTPEQAKKVQALPPAYVRVTLDRRPGGVLRTARTTRRSYRIVLEALGKTEDKTREQRQRAEAALEGAELLIDGVYTTPLIFEPGSAIEPTDDKGWYSGLSSYTYAH